MLSNVYNEACNSISWEMYENKINLELAFAVAYHCMYYVDKEYHYTIVDTAVRILLAMNCNEQAFYIVRQVLSRNLNFNDFQDIKNNPDYEDWVKQNC